MEKRSLVLLVAILLTIPASSPGEEPNGVEAGWGFVCRVLSSQNTGVVTPLSGIFAPDSRIFFLDEKGERCGSGIVRSVYPDLAYITLEGGTAESLKKGFIASTPKGEGEARLLCGFSLNIPFVMEKGGNQGHKVPPNVIVLNYVDNAVRPVYFRHYSHDLGCRKCHHKELDRPCKDCHPLKPTGKQEALGDCLRDRCQGCHKGHEGMSAGCVWCHTGTAPR
ncbi:MAG TPA: cytochrome c3 family protein [Candidatus Methylomirabilis sp.]|nr:cytochrome c3 family protein [Candidatus Methylomirabilis sp.]